MTPSSCHSVTLQRLTERSGIRAARISPAHLWRRTGEAAAALSKTSEDQSQAEDLQENAISHSEE